MKLSLIKVEIKFEKICQAFISSQFIGSCVTGRGSVWAKGHPNAPRPLMLNRKVMTAPALPSPVLSAGLAWPLAALPGAEWGAVIAELWPCNPLKGDTTAGRWVLCQRGHWVGHMAKSKHSKIASKSPLIVDFFCLACTVVRVKCIELLYLDGLFVSSWRDLTAQDHWI